MIFSPRFIIISKWPLKMDPNQYLHRFSMVEDPSYNKFRPYYPAQCTSSVYRLVYPYISDTYWCIVSNCFAIRMWPIFARQYYCHADTFAGTMYEDWLRVSWTSKFEGFYKVMAGAQVWLQRISCKERNEHWSYRRQ